MGKITNITVLSVVMLAATTAAALDVGVGAFYAPGLSVGGGDLPERYWVSPRSSMSRHVSPGGFKALFACDILEPVYLTFGAGINDYKYRDAGSYTTYPEFVIIETVRTLTFTTGADWVLNTGVWRPYVGGGAVAAVGIADIPGGGTNKDLAPGVYVNVGTLYCVSANWAVEFSPRYTLLFDDPVFGYDSFHEEDFIVRAGAKSQFIELLFGLRYRF